MLTEILVVILLVCLAYMHLFKERKGLPPGEKGYPFFGKIPSQKKPFIHHVEERRNKFGDIFYCKMGQRTVVFLCNYSVIKSAFSNPLLADRPNFYSILNFAFGKFLGLKGGNGVMWQNVRRFTVRYLRDRGMGKSSLVPDIETEVKHLIEDFSKHTNEPNEIPWSLNVAILNVIWQMVANRRYDISDKKVQDLQRMINDIFDAFQGKIILIDLMPWIDWILPKFIKRKLEIQRYLDRVEEMYEFLKEVANECRINKNPSLPKTVVESYSEEMLKGESEISNNFSEEELLVVLADLFTAGSDTTASTIRWILLYLSKYPDIQQKLQDELDSVVATDENPSLEDKYRLPYTNAVFHEVMRIMPLLPLSFYHAASEDTRINEYKIPKGAVVIGSIASCHRDARYWEKPTYFYPEHFLNEDGTFNNRKDGFLPFSIGRRSCIGESLASTQIFLITAALLKQFTFHEIPGEELTLDVDPKQPIFSLPTKFRIFFTDRTMNIA